MVLLNFSVLSRPALAVDCFEEFMPTRRQTPPRRVGANGKFLNAKPSVLQTGHSTSIIVDVRGLSGESVTELSVSPGDS